jgi:hypothetical protein
MTWYWIIAISFGLIVLQSVWLTVFYDAIVGVDFESPVMTWLTGLGYGILIITWPIIILLGDPIGVNLFIQAVVAFYLIFIAFSLIDVVENFPRYWRRRKKGFAEASKRAVVIAACVVVTPLGAWLIRDFSPN